MKFETIKSKKKILLIGIILFCIGVTLILTSTLAAYKKTTTIKIAEGTVNYIIPDMKIVAINVQDGVDENGNNTYKSVPDLWYYDTSENYIVNHSETYCDVYDYEYDEWYESRDFVFKFDNNSFTFSVEGIYAKNTKCYIYLDINDGSNEITIDDILASKTKDKRVDFSTIFTEDTTGTIYIGIENYALSYYYAGAPTDNYVKFAGAYWRIIRINGNGSLRMIYSGNVDEIDALTIEDDGITKFDVLANGYDDSETRYTQLCEDYSPYDSCSFDELENYNEYLDIELGFCLDKTYSEDYYCTAFTVITKEECLSYPSSFNYAWELGTIYGPYKRLVKNKAPIFECPDSNDLDKIEAGLITADEVAYVGGVVKQENKNYYLYTGYEYWTWSLYVDNFDSYDIFFTVEDNGSLNAAYEGYGTISIRPVINLKSNILLTGLGTIDVPYEVVGLS
ncbi:MAG: hypothetical protein E7163_02460 [Firmicutes bacterium]|nr:hypothetical protein [Bacillota bacterium]